MTEPTLTLPISTSQGEYYIQLRTAVPESIVRKEDVAQFNNCTIYDILLVCKHRDVLVDMEAMNMIGSELQRILEVNPNIILYIFCDFNDKTIRINKTNKNTPPQEYRSRLFSTLFDRRISKGNRYHFINKVHIVPFDGDTYYLHLIYPEHLSKQATLLKDSIDNIPK